MNILEQTENVYTVAEDAPLEHLIDGFLIAEELKIKNIGEAKNICLTKDLINWLVNGHANRDSEYYCEDVNTAHILDLETGQMKYRDKFWSKPPYPVFDPYSRQLYEYYNGREDRIWEGVYPYADKHPILYLLLAPYQGLVAGLAFPPGYQEEKKTTIATNIADLTTILDLGLN